jgi:putative ABC transport system permease protein
MISNLLRDAFHSLRVMRKNPGFTALAALTLALGIGATTAIFSLVNGIVLHSLPFPESDRIVRLLQSYPEKGLDTWRLSQANFATYEQRSKSFSALAAYSTTGVNLSGVEPARRLQAARASHGLFDVLGVAPLLGRSFLPEEDRPGNDGRQLGDVCIVSHGFWQRQLGGDLDVLGRRLTLNDFPTTIVGVMPPGFSFPAMETELWVPLRLNPEARFPWFLTGIGRLKPGVAPAAAQVETTEILWSAGRQDPQMVSRNDPPPEGAALKTLVVPLKEAIIGGTGKPLFVLQFAVIFILLIACANIANFLLSRSFGRRREIALRYALGASRSRIVTQLLTESVVLALLGAGLGLALAWWGVHSLDRLPVEGIPRIHEVGIDGTVLVSTLILAVFTGLLFGLMPALQTYRLGLSTGMNEGYRGSSGGAGRRMNRALVVAQLALSLILLIGAGLMLKSFRNLLRVSPGFEPKGLLTMTVPASAQKYPTADQALEFYRRLLAEVGRLHEVESAAMTSNLPFSGFTNSDGYLVEGHEPPEGADAPQVQLQTVTAGYFQTMGIRLIRGRDFRPSDRQDAELVTIVDQTLVGRFWPDGDALGKRIRTTGDPEWLTIVGVVAPVRTGDLTQAFEPHMYFHLGQNPLLRMALVARTRGAPEVASVAVQERIREVDPDIPTYDVRTMEEVIGQTLNGQKLTNFLLAVFAVLALVLGTIGIYGVMSVYVVSRTRELGIRLALGEQPNRLKRSVLREGGVLAVVGIAVGVGGALLLTGTLSSLLYGVSSVDPVVFAGLSILLMAVALATSYLPARRAARVDPLLALRHD